MPVQRKDTLGWDQIFQMVGVVVMFPVLILSIIFYLYLHSKHVSGAGRRRIMDIRRMTAPLLRGALLMGVVLVIPFLLVSILHDNTTGPAPTLGGWLYLLPLLLVGIPVAWHLAVMYMGIVADVDQDKLIFPPDMQSYGILDYISLRFVLDYCRTDSVPFSAIKRVTRGHGTDLYIHGDFDSRAIIMSSKQKRDECMTMIQNIIGGRGVVFGELESY